MGDKSLQEDWQFQSISEFPKLIHEVHSLLICWWRSINGYISQISSYYVYCIISSLIVYMGIQFLTGIPFLIYVLMILLYATLIFNISAKKLIQVWNKFILFLRWLSLFLHFPAFFSKVARFVLALIYPVYNSLLFIKTSLLLCSAFNGIFFRMTYWGTLLHYFSFSSGQSQDISVYNMICILLYDLCLTKGYCTLNLKTCDKQVHIRVSINFIWVAVN